MVYFSGEKRKNIFSSNHRSINIWKPDILKSKELTKKRSRFQFDVFIASCTCRSKQATKLEKNLTGLKYIDVVRWCRSRRNTIIRINIWRQLIVAIFFLNMFLVNALLPKQFEIVNILNWCCLLRHFVATNKTRYILYDAVFQFVNVVLSVVCWWLLLLLQTWNRTDFDHMTLCKRLLTQF